MFVLHFVYIVNEVCPLSLVASRSRLVIVYIIHS
jgi:hypothetical protein